MTSPTVTRSTVPVEGDSVPADEHRGVERAAPLWPAALVALAVVTIVLAAVVGTSRSAWLLLGAGHGLIPEEWYVLSGFLLVLATAVGQAAGWAAASALLCHLAVRAGVPPGWATARLAMTVAYLGLATLPLAVYHVLYGGWLLGLPRLGVGEWLAERHPDAYWLLITAHPLIDVSLAPLALLVLAVLWGTGARLRHSFALQTVGWLGLLGTSLAVALSLAIHSTLAHIRLGPLIP